jgi:hypothetical protein
MYYTLLIYFKTESASGVDGNAGLTAKITPSATSIYVGLG